MYSPSFEKKKKNTNEFKSQAYRTTLTWTSKLLPTPSKYLLLIPSLRSYSHLWWYIDSSKTIFIFGRCRYRCSFFSNLIIADRAYGKTTIMTSNKGSSEILILTKSMATTRVFPRMSFIALTLQKAVLFHFRTSSCSNSSVIAFQRQTCPGLLLMILVSWLFCRSLRHICPTTHGSITCNHRTRYNRSI